MNLLIETKDSNIEEFINLGYKNYLFGIKDYSTNISNSLDIDKLLELKDKYNINIFLILNKNLFNSDLDNVKDILKKIDKKVEGLFFYDLSIIKLVRDLGVSIPLVWSQEHMTTNYNTVNYYNDIGCTYTFLSNDITLDEMIEIRNNTNSKLIVKIMGYPMISHSARFFLSNYFSYINKDKNKNIYSFLEEASNKSITVKEDSTGTSIFYNKIINGTKPLIELSKYDFSYFIVSEDIDREDFIKVINNFNSIINNNYDESNIKENNEILGDFTGFFYEKTIYRVKKES